MKVRMTQQMSGPRGDGQDWPPTGGVLETGDGEGAMIVRNGWGVPVVEERKTETAAAPDPKVEVRTEPDPQPAEPPAAPPEEDESALPVEMRRRGRPPGSPNKPKP